MTAILEKSFNFELIYIFGNFSLIFYSTTRLCVVYFKAFLSKVQNNGWHDLNGFIEHCKTLEEIQISFPLLKNGQFFIAPVLPSDRLTPNQ